MYLFQNKIMLNFVIFVATKKGRTKIVPLPPLLLQLIDPGSGIDKSQDPFSCIIPRDILTGFEPERRLEGQKFTTLLKSPFTCQSV